MKARNIASKSSFGFSVFSHRERKPSDLLYRALAHVDHCRFNLECIEASESAFQATALVHISARLPKIRAQLDLRNRVSRVMFPRRHTDSTFWIKVTPTDESEHRFKIIYSVAYGPHIDLSDFETLSRLSETVVLNLFLKIPGIIIERRSMKVKERTNTPEPQNFRQ